MIQIFSLLVEPKKRFFTVTEDPDDNKFLECAIEAKVDYIISGDPHLLDMKKSKTVKIVTPREFLDIISKK